MTKTSREMGDAVAPLLSPTGTPLYRQAKRLILRLLAAGEWPQNKALPSEAQLGARFGVSPGTVKKAITELVSERALVRYQGLGTFVPARDQDYMLNAFFHIVDRATGNKTFPKTELLRIQNVKGEKKPNEQLAISTTKGLVKIENLLYLGNHPVIYDRIYVPQALFPDFNRSILEGRKLTIFGIYQSRYGITITRVKEWIKAAIASNAIAEYLRVPPGTPLLEIERTAFTYEGKPVEYRLRYVNTEHYSYLNELGMKD